MSDTSRELEAVVVKEAMARVRVAELERELAEAKAELEELNAWKKGMRGIEDFYIIREKLHETQSQLTAHKVALTKSYNILEEIVSSPFYQRTCRGGEMERLMNQAIKHLTSVNPNQPSQ